MYVLTYIITLCGSVNTFDNMGYKGTAFGMTLGNLWFPGRQADDLIGMLYACIYGIILKEFSDAIMCDSSFFDLELLTVILPC